MKVLLLLFCVLVLSFNVLALRPPLKSLAEHISLVEGSKHCHRFSPGTDVNGQCPAADIGATCVLGCNLEPSSRSFLCEFNTQTATATWVEDPGSTCAFNLHKDG